MADTECSAQMDCISTCADSAVGGPAYAPGRTRNARKVLMAKLIYSAIASLDSYFAERPLHFVKLDVEGAEAAALRGMRLLLREGRPALAVEFHTEDGWAGREELLGAGYRFEGLGGESVDVGPMAKRVYQCLAFPP